MGRFFMIPRRLAHSRGKVVQSRTILKMEGAGLASRVGVQRRYRRKNPDGMASCLAQRTSGLQRWLHLTDRSPNLIDMRRTLAT